MIPTAVSWHCPPENVRDLTIDSSQVHVWRLDLDQDPSMLFRMYQNLAPDELAIAARFHFKKDHARFVIRRGLLREMLPESRSLWPWRYYLHSAAIILDVERHYIANRDELAKTKG